MQRGNAIEKRTIDWLWKPYLQRGAINLITGDPGIGKSTLICELAAALSAGRALPGQDALPPMNCWIMNGEDSASDTIVWRLENQRADLSRMLVTDQVIAIDSDIAWEIEDMIKEEGVQVVFIDPLQAWMGGKLDMNRANETREWAGLMRTVAQRTGAAVVFVRHRRKGAPGDNNLYAGLGSIDISGFARSEISVLKSQSGRCYITRSKGNVGRKGDNLGYTIEPHTDPLNDHGIFAWSGLFDVEMDGKKGTVVPKQLGKTIKWLRELLQNGPMTSNAVMEAASKARISEGTLRRARTHVADTRQELDGDHRAWYWYLKDDGNQPDDTPEHQLVGVR